MVINYKQLREKREQVKESFRRNEDLTPLYALPRALLMLMKSLWSCHHRHGLIATVIASITFHADWKQLKGFAECLYLRFLPLPPKQGAAMMSEN